jgi:hypothetical protein
MVVSADTARYRDASTPPLEDGNRSGLVISSAGQ